MEASSYSAYLLYSLYSNPHCTRTHFSFISNSLSLNFPKFSSGSKCPRLLFVCPRSSSLTTGLVVDSSVPDGGLSSKNSFPKIDKNGRFCSPRAARELALVVLYAACLDGSDPVRLFDRRLNERRDGYVFDKAFLKEYDHMSFGGPPVTMDTIAGADEILQKDQKESHIEAEVLSAPPKLVYNTLILRFARKLLVAVAENWNTNVQTIEKVAPPNWMLLELNILNDAMHIGSQRKRSLCIITRKEPAGRILEFSILHLAVAEMAVLETRHQIVINEAVDLAKRFCDGAAPRIINGCLRNVLRELNVCREPLNKRI